MFRKGKVLITAVSLFLGTALFFGGCGRQPAVGPDQGGQHKKTPVPQVRPEKTVDIAGVKVTTGGPVRGGTARLASIGISGGTVDYATAAASSPDGRWIAFAGTRDRLGGGLWVMAVDGSDGRLLGQIGEKEHTGGTLLLELLGWTGDNRVLFTRQGTQPDGTHQGQRGLSVRAAAPAEGAVREIAWLPVPAGMVRQVQLLPDKDRVFVHVTGALWRLDITGGEWTLLKDKLPSYDGLFYPRLSPGGDYYVYTLYEQDQKGIYRLSTASGEEKPLAPNGATWNFYPRISPDGSHIAYYAAPLKTGRSGGDAGDYDLIPMEDGPAPVAAAVVLTTAGGREVARITVPEKKIGDVCWAADGKHLAFVAGISKQNGSTGQGADLPEMQWQSVWTADLQGKTKKIGDLSGTPGEVRLVKLGGDGKHVFYHTFAQDESSLWSIREGKAPVEVTPRGGWDYTHHAPVYNEDSFLCRRGAGDEYEVYRVHGVEAVQATADGGWKTNLRVEGDRLLYLREGNPAAIQGQTDNRLVVLSLK